MNQEIILSSAQSLQKYFDNEVKGNSYDQLKQWLTEQIINLLVNDMEKLLNILYRIDVNEKKVKQVFGENDPKLIAPKLAELLIEREMKKAETRILYRKK